MTNKTENQQNTNSNLPKYLSNSMHLCLDHITRYQIKLEQAEETYRLLLTQANFYTEPFFGSPHSPKTTKKPTTRR